MEQYIKKSAVVAEIERLKSADLSHLNGEQTNIYLNTLVLVGAAVCNLEMKEVDLNKEISQFIDANFEKAAIGHKLSLKRVAKHFFELGLKAQHSELTWEDISVLRKIMAEYRRQTSNEMLALNDEDYCKEVLNRFKAQKGE